MIKEGFHYNEISKMVDSVTNTVKHWNKDVNLLTDLSTLYVCEISQMDSLNWLHLLNIDLCLWKQQMNISIYTCWIHFYAVKAIAVN